MQIQRLQIIMLIAMLLTIPAACAEESYIFKQGKPANLEIPIFNSNFQQCPACSCTITITYPNGTAMVKNDGVVVDGSYISYPLTAIQTMTLGVFGGNIYCTDGTEYGGGTFEYSITTTGRVSGGGSVTIFFTIIFLIMCIGMVYLVITSIGHAISLDFDLVDLSWNYGIFFAILGLFYLQESYLGDPLMGNILGWGVDIGILTQMVLPTIYFIMTLTIGSWLQKRVKGVDF